MNTKPTIRYASRRQFIRNSSFIGAGMFLKLPNYFGTDKLQYDHFLLGCSSLETGIQYIKNKTGVGAIPGGKHPNIGTHNALISLGDKTYLEIIAPDPEAPNLVSAYAFLKDLKDPKLFYWAARTNNMDALLKEIKEAGYKNSGINPGSRKRRDGTILKWRSLSIETAIADEVVPFFIEWNKNSKHPSIDSPKGCTLLSFEIEFPEPEKLKAILEHLSIDVIVKPGSVAKLLLKLQSPKGVISL